MGDETFARWDEHPYNITINLYILGELSFKDNEANECADFINISFLIELICMIASEGCIDNTDCKKNTRTIEKTIEHGKCKPHSAAREMYKDQLGKRLF